MGELNWGGASYGGGIEPHSEQCIFIYCVQIILTLNTSRKRSSPPSLRNISHVLGDSSEIHIHNSIKTANTTNADPITIPFWQTMPFIEVLCQVLQEILPIFETSLYKKMAFSRPPIQQNGIFETPYTKNAIFETPLYIKMPFSRPPIQKNAIFETPIYNKIPF